MKNFSGILWHNSWWNKNRQIRWQKISLETALDIVCMPFPVCTCYSGMLATYIWQETMFVHTHTHTHTHTHMEYSWLWNKSVQRFWWRRDCCWDNYLNDNLNINRVGGHIFLMGVTEITFMCVLWNCMIFKK